MSTPPIENSPLIGMWQLISAAAIHDNGTIISDVYGTHSIEYTTYTLDGRMMVMFFRSDRPPLSSQS